MKKTDEQVGQKPVKKKKKDRDTTKIYKKKMLEAMYKTGSSVSKSCELVGVGRTTYYSWLEKDPDFKQAVLDMAEAKIDYVEDKLFALIAAKNVTAIIFYLKTQAKQRGYVERSELTGAGGAPLNDNPNNLTYAEQRIIAENHIKSIEAKEKALKEAKGNAGSK